MITTQKKHRNPDLDPSRTPYVLAAVGMRASDAMEAGKPVGAFACALAKELDRLAAKGRLIVEPKP